MGNSMGNSSMGNSEDEYDIRFEGYKYFREVPIARKITVLKKGESVLFTAQILEVAPAPAGMHGRTRTESSQGVFTEAGNQAPSEIKELIRL